MNENNKNNERKKYCREIVGKKFVKKFNGHCDEDLLKGEWIEWEKESLKKILICVKAIKSN